MVHQLHLQQRPRLLHPARHNTVSLRWLRISRWMIMHQDHRVRLPRQCRSKCLAWMKKTLIERPSRHFLHRQHLVLGIQADHSHALVIKQPHFLAQKPRHIFRRIDRPCFGFTPRQSRRQCKCCFQSDGFGFSDSFDSRQLSDGCPAQCLERSKMGQQKLSEIENGPLGGAGAQEDGEELGCLQCVRPLVHQPLPRSFRWRKFAHRSRRHRPPP